MWHRIGSGDTFPVFIPHRVFLVFRICRCHRLSGNSVVRAFMPATGARPNAAEINLMDCSCPSSEVEIVYNSKLAQREVSHEFSFF